MIGYVVPHTLYPQGYHVNPKEFLPFISLANQKNYIALYHMALYADKDFLQWFVDSYNALGIGKPDIGKSCVRFKNVNKIPLGLIGELCEKITPDAYIEMYETAKPKSTK